MMFSSDSGEDRAMKKIPEERSDLWSLSPYHVPQERVEVELDSNENPANLPQEIIKEIQEQLSCFDFNRYPEIAAISLRETIAALYGLNVESVQVGNGSNEVILNLLLAFGGPERNVVTFEPSYSMHDVIIRISGTGHVKIPLAAKTFSIDSRKAIEEIRRVKPGIVFVCSPNNPTGNSTPVEVIQDLLEKTDSLIVVDEAYGEFAETSALDLPDDHPNLVIVKTLSKALRLAALRVGYVLAAPEIIASFNKVKLPYNMNAFSQHTAELVLRKQDLLKDVIDAIILERERVYNGLKQIEGIEPYSSQANFVLFKVDRPKEVFRKILDAGVLIRDFSDKPRLEGCLRVTIGEVGQNDIFMQVLKESLS